MTRGFTIVSETSMGFTGAVTGPAGIRRATLFHPAREAVLRDLGRDAPALATPGSSDASAMAALLKAFAEGRASLDDYPVDLSEGTPFQRGVWNVLRTVPRGETRTYGWVARQTGSPAGAARAVGAAVGANRIPLWVPCHRIIGSDGKLHGFAGGLAMKQALLEMEGALPRALT